MASETRALRRAPPDVAAAGTAPRAPVPRPMRFEPPAPPAWPALLGQGARQGWPLLLAGAALAAYGVASGAALWALAGLLLGVVPAVRVVLQQPRIDRHRRMRVHHARGQWDAVRVLATALGGRRSRRDPIAFDADVRLAAMAAREGGLEAGLRRISAWRGQTPGGPVAYESAIAEVCLMAGETTGHVAAMGRAHEADPGHGTTAVDAALAHARFGEVERAEALLARVDVARLPAAPAARARWARGLLALRRASPDAEVVLAQAVDALLAATADPSAWPHQAACVADHAIALHQAGRDDEARRRIADVWPVLEVHATVPMLRMLEADGLLPDRSRSPT